MLLGLHLVLVTLHLWFHNLSWAREIELLTLYTIFSVVWARVVLTLCLPLVCSSIFSSWIFNMNTWQLVVICSIASSSCILVYEHMAIGNSMFNNIGILLAYWNVKVSLIAIPKCCYATYHTINTHALQKIILKINVMLIISNHDTFRPIATYFRPFTNVVCGNKHHNQCNSKTLFVWKVKRFNKIRIQRWLGVLYKDGIFLSSWYPRKLGVQNTLLWTLHLGPLHTWDWEPVPITLQTLSLMEKTELVQVRFTLRLRDQRSMWMQDGCKVCMDSYMASNGSCFMVTWWPVKNHL